MNYPKFKNIVSEFKMESCKYTFNNCVGLSEMTLYCLLANFMTYSYTLKKFSLLKIENNSP